MFIGNQAGLPLDGVQQRLTEPVTQGGQALVFVDAGGGAVADGDNADANTVATRVGLGVRVMRHGSFLCSGVLVLSLIELSANQLKQFAVGAPMSRREAL